MAVEDESIMGDCVEGTDDSSEEPSAGCLASLRGKNSIGLAYGRGGGQMQNIIFFFLSMAELMAGGGGNNLRENTVILFFFFN